MLNNLLRNFINVKDNAKPKTVNEQLDALDSVLGVDRSTNSDNFLERMEVLPFRATIPRKRDVIDNSAIAAVGPSNYGDNDDTRMNDVSMYVYTVLYHLPHLPSGFSYVIPA